MSYIKKLFKKIKINKLILSTISQLLICIVFLSLITLIVRKSSGNNKNITISTGSGFVSLYKQVSDVFSKSKTEYDSVESRYSTASRKILGQAVEVTSPSTNINFICPIKSGYIIRMFGYETMYDKTDFCDGIDIAPTDDYDVLSSCNGKIKRIETNVGETYSVYVNVTEDLIIIYQNLSDVTCSNGDMISAGDKIGSLKEEKNSFLHISIIYKNEPINPGLYINTDEE